MGFPAVVEVQAWIWIKIDHDDFFTFSFLFLDYAKNAQAPKIQMFSHSKVLCYTPHRITMDEKMTQYICNPLYLPLFIILCTYLYLYLYCMKAPPAPMITVYDKLRIKMKRLQIQCTILCYSLLKSYSTWKVGILALLFWFIWLNFRFTWKLSSFLCFASPLYVHSLFPFRLSKCIAVECLRYEAVWCIPKLIRSRWCSLYRVETILRSQLAE